MCDMSKQAVCLLTGMAIGIMVGYQKEDEIEELTRSSRRAKRKMMRKMHDVKDHLDF